MVLSWGHWRAAALMVAHLCPKGKRDSALSVLTKPVMPIAALILCAALAAGQALPTCAGLVKIGLPPPPGLPTCAPRPAGQDRLPGWSRSAVTREALPGFRLAAGQRRVSGRYSGSVADVPGLPPGWSLGERCRRAPGFRPVAAGLVKIGRHSGSVAGLPACRRATSGFRPSLGERCRRADVRRAGQDRLAAPPGLPTCAPRHPVLSVASDLLSCADLCNAVH